MGGVGGRAGTEGGVVHGKVGKKHVEKVEFAFLYFFIFVLKVVIIQIRRAFIMFFDIELYFTAIL